MRVFIEQPGEKNQKNVFDKVTGKFLKTVHIDLTYPYPYGYILDTLADDGDELDCYVITDKKLETASVVECEPIGIWEWFEDGEEDHKILVALKGEMPMIDEIVKAKITDFANHFFDNQPEKKYRLGEFLAKGAALSLIKRCTENISSKMRVMQRERVIGEIEERKPKLVYVSGKTCTGKTTFANELQAHGYLQIELDQIVTRSVIEPFQIHPREAFLAAFRGIGSVEQTNAFITAARTEIIEKAKSNDLVIEGAIEKVGILQEILSGELADFYFIYFHPVDFNVYVSRIRSRFIAGRASTACGLPKDFWALTHKEDIDFFLETNSINDRLEESLRAYATRSMTESVDRLKRFQEAYPNLSVVEV